MRFSLSGLEQIVRRTPRGPCSRQVIEDALEQINQHPNVVSEKGHEGFSHTRNKHIIPAGTVRIEDETPYGLRILGYGVNDLTSYYIYIDPVEKTPEVRDYIEQRYG